MPELRRRTDTSLTAITRAAAQHNEDQVLAARALENERRVSAVRVLTLVLLVISQGLIAGLENDEPSGEGLVLHRVGLGLYFLYSIGALIYVQRVKVHLTRATLMPLVATTVDVGFVMLMSYVDVRFGRRLEIENSAVMLALILSYSILRYSVTSLWYSGVLAIVGFAITLIWMHEFGWPTFTFVSFVYVALAVLLWAVRRAMHTAFVDLKRREGLSRLVAPKVVDQILAGRDEVLLPTRREATILFLDLRNFTAYSESRDPQDVLRLLDDYFGRMTQVVQGHDGVVNKFIGDGMLALWGVPTPLADHAVHAVKAALDMQKVLAELNERRAEQGEPELACGIGIHTGVVAAGLLGSSAQAEYSVIGDAVNLASRIEGLTKEHSTPLLVSEATWERVSDRFVGHRVAEATVKGRRAPVVLYAIERAIPGARSVFEAR